MDTYPYYENQDYVEKTGQWTLIEWLNDAHFRVYFPDRTGRLRLIVITNRAEKDYRALAEDTLWHEFDVTYRDLNFEVGDGAQRAATLDDRCPGRPRFIQPVHPGIRRNRKNCPTSRTCPCIPALMPGFEKESCLGNRPAPQIQKHSDFGNWP